MNHPVSREKVLYGGRWVTPEQIERIRAYQRVANHRPEQVDARRVYEASGKRYLSRRRRLLGRQREQILGQLEALKEGL